MAVMVFLVALFSSSWFIAPKIQNSTLIIVEGPLQKNSQLHFQNGDIYEYVYKSGNSSANVTFLVTDHYSCMMLNSIDDASGPGSCIDRTLGTDRAMQNSSLEDATLLIYRPWMLALRDGWTWNVSVYMTMDGYPTKVSEIDYRVMRRDVYQGRPIFVVQMVGDGLHQITYVDEERRVLVYMEGDGFEISLKNMSRSGPVG